MPAATYVREKSYIFECLRCRELLRTRMSAPAAFRVAFSTAPDTLGLTHLGLFVTCYIDSRFPERVKSKARAAIALMNRMRILLQQKETGLYFKDIESWVRTSAEAMDFVSSTSAIEFCVVNKLG